MTAALQYLVRASMLNTAVNRQLSAVVQAGAACCFLVHSVSLLADLPVPAGLAFDAVVMAFECLLIGITIDRRIAPLSLICAIAALAIAAWPTRALTIGAATLFMLFSITAVVWGRKPIGQHDAPEDRTAPDSPR